MSAKTKVCRQLDRVKPEFGEGIVAIYVMRRFIRFVAVEIESVGGGN
jgi:hypothetical protein